MTDKEIVIKISEENYELAQRFCKGTIILDEFLKPKVGRIIITRLMKAIGNGTPLPKGHGRLIDVDDLTWARHTVDRYGYEEDTVVSWDDIVDAPTIIEADKGDKE